MLARELLDVIDALSRELKVRSVKKGAENFRDLVESGKVRYTDLLAYGLWAFNVACNFGGLVAAVGINGYNCSVKENGLSEELADKLLRTVYMILKGQIGQIETNC